MLTRLSQISILNSNFRVGGLVSLLNSLENSINANGLNVIYLGATEEFGSADFIIQELYFKNILNSKTLHK